MSENDGSTELTAKQELLIAALIAGNNIQTSAKAAHISEKTAQRWLKIPHFQQAHKAAQRQVFDQALTSLMLRVDKAVETLDRNMSGEDTPASTQVRAAQIVIEQSINVYKVAELEEKYKELEQLIKQPLQAGRH